MIRPIFEGDTPLKKDPFSWLNIEPIAGILLIATDGGAIPMKGSNGFIIADEDGNILLTCFGQPAGNNPLSFRSEICAFLAAIRLVTLLNQYYDDILCCTDPARSKIQVYTDSLSMITKLEAYGEYPTAPLATALDSEWNVFSALHRALKIIKTCTFHPR